MSRKVIVGVGVWAASVGAIVAVMTGDNRAVSLRIWLAAFAVWFGLAVLHRLFAEVPLEHNRLRLAVRWRRRRPPVAGPTVGDLRALESLVMRSRDNERAFVQQLRPRLIALADHHLPMTHGLDPRRRPDAAAELFGPMAWIVAPDGPPGTPTIAELDAVLDIVLGDDAGSPIGRTVIDA